MKKHLKSVLTLFVICAIVSVALAVVNGITAPIILEKQQAAASGALAEVMPNGGTFTKMELPGNLPASIKEVHEASNGGYVFQVEFDGFTSGNVAMVGVSADGEITGTKIITNKESSGYGADILPQLDGNKHYNGSTIDTIDAVSTIAGCTVSTKAYRAAIKDALSAAVILGGGSVDLRDPAQILNDNLNAALGVTGVKFEKHFFSEEVEGVDDIYVAENNAGYVVVIGETYVGVGADGNVIGEANEVVAKAIATIKATTFTELDLTLFTGLSERIKSAKVTNDDVYVFEIEGAGYGINGSYGSKEYIMIKLAITAEGKVIDCLTMSQNETPNYGDGCANEDFYGQFIGKTENDYTDTRVEITPNDRKDYVSDMDAITGATVTSAGYKLAIMNAYNAVKIFEGGTN